MENRERPNNIIQKQPGKRKKGSNLFFPLLICVGAVAFYFFISHTSNIKTPPAQPEQSSSQAVSSAPAPSSASPESRAESTASVPKTESRIENQVSLKDAAKPVNIKVNLTDQMVVVYDAKGRVVQNFVCSTGKEGSDTPAGTYTVKQRGESFYSKQYQEGAYYWTQFQGDFLFHSVPFDKNRNMEPEEAAKLGSKASHGCVRLALENAKWIYDNIPKGTKVVIA